MFENTFHQSLLLFLGILCGCVFTERAFAQEQFVIQGTVSDREHGPLYGTAVVAFDRANGRMAQGVSSDSCGCFQLPLPTGSYIIECSFIGYEKTQFEYLVKGPAILDSVFLSPIAQTIGEVVVRAPEITYKTNGYVLRVGQNPLYHGAQLTDILEMAPGIWIDSHSLSAYGKDIAQVYVNERRIRLSGEDLMQYLKTFNSEIIREIEVVFSSGVEGDASAMGSRILKITTKKGLNRSTLLNISSDLSYTQPFFSYNPRINLNIRKNKFSSYLIGGYSRNKSESKTETEESFYDNDVINRARQKDILEIPSVNALVGLGYDFNPNHLLSIEASYASNKSDLNSKTNSLNDVYGTPVEILEKYRSHANTNFTNTSLNYLWEINEKSRIVCKADWLQSHTDKNQHNYLTNYAYPERHNENAYARNIYTASLDFTRALRHDNDELLFGVKHSYTSSNNSALYKELHDGTWTENPDFTDDYQYREQITSLYGKYNLQHQRFHATLGVRMEYSGIDPYSKIHPKDGVKSNYCDFFPEIGVSYEVGKQRDCIFSLRWMRSIQRPPFNDLNPYIYPLNTTSYLIGNPYLTPAYSYTSELNVTLKNKYVVVCSYTKGKDKIWTAVFKDDASDMIYQQKQNFGSTKDFSLYVQAPIQISDWWQIDVSASYRYSLVKHKQTIKNHLYSGGLKAFFRLPRNFNLILSGKAYSSFLTGNSKGSLDPDLSVRMAKQLLNNRLYIGLHINDLLNSEGRFKLKTFSPNFSQIYRYRYSSRTFLLNVGFTFKSGKSDDIRKVKAGNEDERDRE